MSVNASVTVVGHAESVLPCACTVGESLIWDDQKQVLLWVDMLGQCIHIFSPQSKAHEVQKTDGMVTSIGLRKDGGYIVGLERSLALWEPGGRFEEFVAIEPNLPGNRLNEGVVGPDGCYWIGTMQNNVDSNWQPKEQTEASGQVWRISPDGQVELMVSEKFWLTNTIAWVEDRVVIGETGHNTLYRFTENNSGNKLTDKQTFLKDYPEGLPDGSCVDSSSHLWNCRVVGGAEILCINPDGTPVQRVSTPCTWPTSCTFGGADLNELYITSARFTMSPAHLNATPWEGDLFSCQVPGVTGTPANRFG